MSELDRSRRGGASTTHEAPSGGNQATPGKRSLAESAGGGRLDDTTRGRMESSFGTSFGGVNVHADSPRASGSTHAFTEGNDVHFAPGKYDPGSTGGNWLIAHELAHVVQQSGAAPATQRFNPSEPGLAHEAEADRAADAAVSGGKADVQLSTRSGMRQNYEAWEHRAIADSGGGAARTITVNCGITLTYGQVCALSGDFYRSPEALMNAPRPELEAILRTMDRERKQAGVSDSKEFGTGAPKESDINANNAAYELATSGAGSRASHHDDDANPFLDDPDHAGGPDAAHPHGRVTQGNHVEDNGTAGAAGAPATAEASFLGLADNNASHFSPENIKLNFTPKHQLAIDLAKEAWRVRNPGGTPAATPAPGAAPTPGATPGHSTAPTPGAAPAPAHPAAAAPAPHPSAGPVPAGAAIPSAATVSTASTDPGQRKEAMAYLSDGFAAHFLTDAFASGHLVSGSVGRTLGTTYYNSHAGAISTALKACLQAEYPAAAIAMGPAGVAAVIGGMSALVSSKSGSLTLKLVHDYFNKHGVVVKNPANTQWQTVGDANLASSSDTQVQASLAAQASREGVEKAAREGTLSDEERDKPLQYVPSHARFASGDFKTIAAFCEDATIFDAVLSETMLSPKPGDNKLWQLIKGNAAPMISLKLTQGGRWVGDLATGAYQTVAGAAQTAGKAVVRGAEAVGNGVVRGAEVVGNGVVRGAEAVGRGAQVVGQGVVRGAEVVGNGVVRGAEVVGDGVVRGAEATGRGFRAVGTWVSSLFD